MTLKHTLKQMFRGKDGLDLVGGPIGRNLLYLSVPIVITNLLKTAYNLADTFWLGRHSTEALAAIGFAFPIIFFFISLGMGWAVAGSVLVAQYVGAGSDERATFAASQTVTFTVVTALALGAIGYVVVGPLTALLGAGPTVQPLAASFLQIISLGLVPMFGFAIFTALMRGYGDTVTPMILMFATVVLNVVFDPLLIFGWGPFPRLGVDGAAIATVLCRSLAFLVGLWIMLDGRRGVRISIREMIPDFAFLKKMLRVGVPASVEGAGRSISVNILLAIIGSFSTSVVAAYGIGVRILIMVFLPAIAVERAVETMTGQNIGAGRPERATRANVLAAKWLFAILTGIGILIFLGAEIIISVFTSDPEVISIGEQFLNIVALTFGFTGVMRAFSGGFRGVGKTMVAAAMAFLTLGAIRLPVAWFASGLLGPTGIWMAFAVSNVSGAAIAYAWFRRSDWSEALVTPEARRRAETAEELVEYAETIEPN
jgi:putative MATE family efflux protein